MISVVPMILAIVVGTVALIAIIFGAVFVGLKAANRSTFERFEREGVLARVGDGFVTVVARNYRSASRYAGGLIKKNPGELLLTPTGLHAVGVRLEPGSSSYDLGPDDLENCRAWLADGWLHVATASPPNATGEVELRTRAEAGAEEFLAQLRQRGVSVGSQQATAR